MTREEALNILGLKGNAGTKAIKKAYRKKALRFHPDKGGEAKTFAMIANAYGLLTGKIPQKRRIVGQPMRWGVVWVKYGYTSTNTTASSTF